ncbi:MAG: hypothetical protein IIV90_06650, partial [Oscillospiraceae bacterium]|nr:hypothetical protein [Oscillospiraceae bacterium]
AYVTEDARNRYAFGFLHPNVFSLYISALVWAWLLLRWHRLCIWEFFLMGGVQLVVYHFSDSRAFCLFSLASLCAACFFFCFPRLMSHRVWPFLFALLPWAGALFTLLPCYYYTRSKPLWKTLNSLFSGRMRIFNEIWSETGWSLWGRNTACGDSIFMFFQVRRGFVCWLVFVAAFSLLFYLLARSHWWAELAVTINIFGLGLTEATVRNMSVNFSYWLFVGLIFALPLSRWPRFSLPKIDLKAASGGPHLGPPIPSAALSPAPPVSGSRASARKIHRAPSSGATAKAAPPPLPSSSAPSPPAAQPRKIKRNPPQ